MKKSQQGFCRNSAAILISGLQCWKCAAENVAPVNEQLTETTCILCNTAGHTPQVSFFIFQPARSSARRDNTHVPVVQSSLCSRDEKCCFAVLV